MKKSEIVKELQELKRRIDNLEPIGNPEQLADGSKIEHTKLEAGKWYKYPKNDYLIHIIRIENNKVYFYGFALDGHWMDPDKDKYILISTMSDLIKATSEEVEEALIKEAERRKYTNNNFNSLVSSSENNFDGLELINIQGNQNYYVDKLGNTYSFFKDKLRKLKPNIDKAGYLSIQISGVRRIGIHRAVALTFISNPENKRTVNHIDGDKANNTVENLEWATYSENHIHAYKHLGRINAFTGLKGEKSPYSKKINQLDMDGNIIKTWNGLNEAHRNGFNMGCIIKVIKGQRNHHKGFKWEYNTHNGTITLKND